MEADVIFLDANVILRALTISDDPGSDGPTRSRATSFGSSPKTRWRSPRRTR
jgi:hypothetical protein